MILAENMEAIVVSPNRSDAELTCNLLEEAGINAIQASDVLSLLPRLPANLGCAVIVEEALSRNAVDALSEVLSCQPPWCDFPFIIISGQENMPVSILDRLFPYSGNITLLQRPLSPATILSAVRVALLARRRQYEVRDLLSQRERAMRSREEFLAMLAHELRNPLAPIRNAAHVLKTLPINDPVFLKARGLIEKQVLHMSRLVNDLLDVTRLELGKVQLQREPMLLNAAISSALESCAEMIAARAHTLHMNLTSATLQIDGDPIRIEQIISNLVANAAKYTPRGGVIEVRSECEGHHAMLSVIDNGMGISPGLENTIFELFSQDEKTLARSEGGLGIGLTVVKRLVDLHGGSIEATSLGVNKGARFVVRLPLTTTPSGLHPAVEAHAVNSARRRVLVVEDNADIRDSLQLLCEMWGHEVHFAETGAEGVALARQVKPDVALIDIGLPGMNGYEVASALRSCKDEAMRFVKLVAMTGYGQPGDIENAKSAGFDAHLLKPVEPDLLQEIITASN
jgi:signal transduction histidine kinase/ActR/RegA family two-component response regulator